MRAFIAFTKKEFVESFRTYKLLTALAIFLIFGMMNPITAKILPEILSGLLPEGMQMSMPDPVPLDSWGQFYKNMSTQLIIFAVVFSGIIAGELSKGTLVNMLTKGLPRRTVIFSKFTAVTFIWTLSFALCYAATYGYTLYLLPGEVPNLFDAAFFMWLFGVLIISVLLFGGALSASIYGSLLLTGGFVLLLMLIALLPNLQKFTPFRLASENTSLLTHTLSLSDFYPAAVISCLLIALFLFCTTAVFNKRRV